MSRIIAGIAIAAVVILAGVAWFLGYVPNTSREQMRRAKITAAADLLDPASAQFRRLTVGVFKAGKSKGEPVVCGEINGKNANGAYAGYDRFIVKQSAAPTTTLAPRARYTKAELLSSEAKCEVVGKNPPSDLHGLLEARRTCEHVIEVMTDRQPLEAFEAEWSKTTCVLPAN